MEGEWQQVLCRVKKVVFDLVGMRGKPLGQIANVKYDCIFLEHELPNSSEVIVRIPYYNNTSRRIEPDLGNMSMLATTLRGHAETLASGGRSIGIVSDVIRVLCVVASVPKLNERGTTYVVEVFEKPVTKLTKLLLFPSPL